MRMGRKGIFTVKVLCKEDNNRTGPHVHTVFTLHRTYHSATAARIGPPQ